MDDFKLVNVLRASIRPLVTLALAAALGFLVARGVASTPHGHHAGAAGMRWQESIAFFLAIYAPILGFWYAQQAHPQTRGERGSRRSR